MHSSNIKQDQHIRLDEGHACHNYKDVKELQGQAEKRNAWHAKSNKTGNFSKEKEQTDRE